MKTDICPKPTDLVISTCTVVSNVNNDINLNFLSRVVPIYDMFHQELEKKRVEFIILLYIVIIVEVILMIKK